MVFFTTLTCGVQVDHSVDHEPALICGTHQVCCHPRFSKERCKPSVCLGSSPSLSLGAPQHWEHQFCQRACFWGVPQAGSLAGSPHHAGFVSPPLAHTGADLNCRGITARTQKLQGREPWSFIHTQRESGLFLIYCSNIQGTIAKLILSKLFTITFN